MNEQLTVLLEGQLVQDERLLELEGTETLESTITDLQASDFEINLSINQPNTRVSTLESLNGTDEDVMGALNKLDAEAQQLNVTLEGLSGSVTIVKESVLTLEQIDHELGTAVDELDFHVTELESLNGTSDDVADELNDLDTRLSKLELDGTVAFHVSLLESCPTVPEGNIVIFDCVNVNLGSCYNVETGQFTTPSDGAGLYYIYAHFEGDDVESARM